FADRIVREAGTNPEDQIEQGLLMALGHQPDVTRVREGVAFLQNQSERLRSEGVKEGELHSEALTDFC
ncbi:MAG: hypothetical protein KDA84_05310, partial [Planctomycetaceae bacterium]|nr:hypothetical protein [Planctomycetaceae bacterium]